MNHRKRAVKAIALLIPVLLLTQAYACSGSATHKVTVAQHNFRYAVQAFQDAEIAEHEKGFVDNDTHVRIQTIIQKVAQAGVDLDTTLAANATTPTIKGKLDVIYNLLDSLNNDGLLFIKNPTTKATLEVALEAIKAIITNAETLISEGTTWQPHQLS